MSSPLLGPALAVGVPVAASLVLASCLWLTRRRQALGTPAWAGWEGAALALGLGAAVVALRGWPALPPGNLNDWPALLALPAAALALAAGASWRWFLPLAVVFVALAAPLMLTVPLRGWTIGQAALWLPAYAVPWLLLILAARTTAVRLPEASLPAWAAAVGVSAIAVHLAAATSLAEFLGGAAAAAGAYAVCRMFLGDRIRPASAAVALAALVPLWWLLAHTLTDNLPALALVPLAAAPLAAWLAWPLRAHRWTSAITAAVAGGGIAALALLLIRQPPPAPVGW